MRLGYARLGVLDYGLEVQLEMLEGAGCERIYREKKAGGKRSRAELTRLLAEVREGDTVVVWRLDRMVGSTRALLEVVERLGAAGAGLQSICEPWADTAVPGVAAMFEGMAEFERDLIRERLAAGREAAKLRGVRFGRPGKLNVEQAKAAKKMLGEGKSISEVSRAFGVHRATIYRVRG